MKKAILSGQNPFYTEYIYYPYGTGLIYDAFTPLRGLLSIPLQLVFGLIPAHNLMILGSLVSMGFFMYLLVNYLTKSRTAAFLSGCIFLLSPYVASKIENHQNLSELQYLPLFVLALCKLKEKQNKFWMIMTSLSLVAIFLNDYYQFFIALLIILLFLIFNTDTITQKKSILSTLAVSYILLLPFFVLFIKDFIEYKYPVIFESEKLLIDPVRFFLPPQRSWFYREVLHLFMSRLGRAGEEPYLGVILIFIVISQLHRLLKMRFAKFAFLLFCVGVIFGLGPHLSIYGHSFPQFSLPFSILLKIPILQNLRASARFMILILFAFSLLFAFAYRQIVTKVPSRLKFILFGTFFLLIVIEYLSIPIKMTRFFVPEFYQTLRHDKEEYAIWTLPTEFWLDETGAALAQTVHGKKVLGGFVSRPSQKITDIYYSLPVISELITNQYDPNSTLELTQEEIEIKRKKALEFFLESKIKYVIFYKNVSDTLYKNHQLIEFYQIFFPDKSYYEDKYISVFKVY